jgi:hypothetical protein
VIVRAVVIAGVVFGAGYGCGVLAARFRLRRTRGRLRATRPVPGSTPEPRDWPSFDGTAHGMTFKQAEAAPTIWGMRIVTDPTIPEGTYLFANTGDDAPPHGIPRV